MKSPTVPEDDGFPWDLKTVKIELGDHCDRWLFASVFNDSEFSISFRQSDDEEFQVDEMHLDVARRLRDFLNYAVPK